MVLLVALYGQANGNEYNYQIVAVGICRIKMRAFLPGFDGPDFALDKGMYTRNAAQWLRNDHKILRGLFMQLHASERGIEERSIERELLMMIQIHSSIEKEIFYPAFQKAADANGKGLIEEHLDAHARVDGLVNQISTLSSADPTFDILLLEIVDSMVEHISDEETLLLPMVESVLGNSQAELAVRMQRKKEELMELPEFAEARPEVVQNPRGGEQKRRIATV